MKRSPMPRSTKPMKSSRPKMTKIRASARGEDCTLNFPGICSFDSLKVVLCHRNGAGAGMKSEDHDAAYGCFDCHQVLDGQAPRPSGFTREAMLDLFERGVLKTQAILRRKKLI